MAKNRVIPKIRKTVVFEMEMQDFSRVQAVAGQDYRPVGSWIRKALLEKLAEIEVVQSKAKSA